VGWTSTEEKYNLLRNNSQARQEINVYKTVCHVACVHVRIYPITVLCLNTGLSCKSQLFTVFTKSYEKSYKSESSEVD